MMGSLVKLFFCSLAAVSMVGSAVAQQRYARPGGAVAPAMSRMSAGSGARNVAAGGSLGGIQSGMAAFAADMGRMPTGAEGLMALIQRPAGATNWRGPYISTNNYKPPFTDPWGNQYRYTATPAGANRFIYTIASNGPDGLAGTRDDLQVQF